jgi:membrane-associated phospholipid phosphatase
MITIRLFLILSILILCQSLFSQEVHFNHSMPLMLNRNPKLMPLHPSPKIDYSLKKDNSIPANFTDTLSFKSINTYPVQDQIVHPQWMRAAIVPTALIVAGTITLLPESHCWLSKYTIHDKILEMAPGIHTSADNYIQYVPLVTIFGLKAAGVESRSDFANQVAITAKAELLMGVIVHGMKTWIPSDRPYFDGRNSMPSGHTAQAFVTATILDMEYRDTSPWIGVGGYAVATTTAVGRMVNNKHWISDVLIGAGIGIFSAKAVYFTHQYHWGKKNNIVLLPAIYKNGGGASFAMIL